MSLRVGVNHTIKLWAYDCFPPLFRFAPAVSYETKRGDTAKQNDGGRNDGAGSQ
jgi:hypothetical protein